MKKMKSIVFSRKTPYMTVGIDEIRNEKGESFSLKEKSLLCRCGKSKDKPYCDGSHNETGLYEVRLEGCPSVPLKSYTGEEVVIHFRPQLCYHSENCVRGLPEVFNRFKRPWVNANGAGYEAIIEQIGKCPSGALSYTGREGDVRPLPEDSIIIRKNGPYVVRGDIRLVTGEDIAPHTAERYSLCRCGKSKNKPFCDGSHEENPFEEKG